MRNSVKFAIIGGIAATMMSGPAAAQTKLMFDVFLPFKHPLKTGIQDHFKESVEKATNKRVMVQFPSAMLAAGSKQWEALESGITDVSLVMVGWYRQRIKLPTIAHLPFMVPNAEKASVAVWRTQRKYFDKANEFKGLKLLGFVTHNGSQIANSKRQINTIDDLKGLKIRASAGEATQVVNLLGANPVTTSGPKIFEYVSKGVVDGLDDGLHAPLAFKITRYLKYATQVPGSLGTITFALLVSGKQWDGLSSADQRAIEGVSGEGLSAYGGKKWDDFTKVSIAKMKEDGVVFTKPSAQLMAQIKERLQPMEAAWIKGAEERGVDGKAAIAYYRQQAFH